ncbi:MAG: SDR family NAD(P)-dependent oxidoreductase [Synechococcales bacterium]|nr:SDR family NAD(P)-dependent oxidoreductase [Synechococcales bacterium]
MPLIPGVEATNALVVGANRGIGLAFVNALLRDPSVATIYATYRDRAAAAALLAIQEHQGDRLVCLPLELTQEDQIATAVQQIQAQTPRLHWVMNCVGFLHEGDIQPEKSLRQLDLDHLTRYFQVNSISAALLAKHLLPVLKHGDRSIFATLSAKIGSIGDNRLGGWYGYRASKAALNMLMRTVAIEYSRKSPKTIVVTLHPGTTDTRLSQPFQKNVPPEQLFSTGRTVTQLLTVLSNLTDTDSGQFFSWDGSRLPW